ncbi:DUF559 domain-containing protein [Spongisporangium articulatum]|uniref:DUF559 domain-containing protein n=1 Tax=Spongisporangium articulatum TaxID=3362603 RepID=A0ABW8APA7_9ACTN
MSSRQSGVFTRAQAHAAGWSDYRIRRRLDDGSWRQLLGRGLVGGSTPVTPLAVAWATHLSHPRGVISHTTAGWLYGFPLASVVHEQLAAGTAGHVLTDVGTAVPGVVRHRVIQPRPTVRFAGLPLTGRLDTALDCLVVLPRDRAVSLWGWLSSRAVLDRSRLAQEARARFGRPGTPNLLAILGLSGTGAASVAERRLHDILRRGRITGWEANVPVRVNGVIVAVADVLFAAARLVVEVDGWAAHGSREAFVNDRRRQNLLMNAGYRVLRFTWDDLVNRPREVLAEITAAAGFQRVSLGRTRQPW